MIKFFIFWGYILLITGTSFVWQAYPFEIDWSAAYHDPAQPLVVDIGSGICSVIPLF